MQSADDYQQVFPGLCFWQAYEASVKVELGSCSVQLGEDLYFIDPIRLDREPLAELVSSAKPTGIVLTNGNHERAAAWYKKQFNLPVYAHEEARGEFEVPVDHWIAGDGLIVPGLAAVALPGAAKGEIALHADLGHGVMLVGDALIHLEPNGLDFLPAKYCLNPKLMKSSLAKLLAFAFETLTFAHGLPIVTGAKRRLEEML